MSDLLHTESLTLFESDDPSGNEIIEALELYASNKLAELGVDVSDIETKRVHISGKDTVTIDIRCAGNNYTATIVEWAYAQGLAAPLVELRRQ